MTHSFKSIVHLMLWKHSSISSLLLCLHQESCNNFLLVSKTMFYTIKAWLTGKQVDGFITTVFIKRWSKRRIKSRWNDEKKKGPVKEKFSWKKRNFFHISFINFFKTIDKFEEIKR